MEKVFGISSIRLTKKEYIMNNIDHFKHIVATACTIFEASGTAQINGDLFYLNENRMAEMGFDKPQISPLACLIKYYGLLGERELEWISRGVDFDGPHVNEAAAKIDDMITVIANKLGCSERYVSGFDTSCALGYPKNCAADMIRNWFFPSKQRGHH